MGSAVYPRAHKRQCSPWQPVRLPEAANWLVQAAPLTRVRKSVADRESAEDDLSCHRLSRQAAERGQPMPEGKAQPPSEWQFAA